MSDLPARPPGSEPVTTCRRATTTDESVIHISGERMPRRTCEPPKLRRLLNQIEAVVYRSGCAIGDERSMTSSCGMRSSDLSMSENSGYLRA